MYDSSTLHVELLTQSIHYVLEEITSMGKGKVSQKKLECENCIRFADGKRIPSNV